VQGFSRGGLRCSPAFVLAGLDALSAGIGNLHVGGHRAAFRCFGATSQDAVVVVRGAPGSWASQERPGEGARLDL
jgi:hypothetical protein